VWDYDSFDYHDRILYVTPIAGPTVLTFNATSGVLKSMWGENTFWMPHGLSVDKHDNIWITDVGLHQVFKFSPTGQKLLELGVAREPGSSNRHFCKPTDIAVASDGTFYVADGYCNGRILKFSPEGRLLQTWGSVGGGPGQFYIPHSLKLDERRGRLYVADRENGRVEIFDANHGTFLESWTSVVRRAFALDFPVPTGGSEDYLFVVDGPNLHGSPKPVYVHVLDMNNHGNKVEHFGNLKQPHDIVVTNKGKEVYVAEITLDTVIKYVKV